MPVRNIVVVGASFAGISVAHYWLRKIEPVARKAGGDAYKVVLIDQSEVFWSKISAPRAMVTEESVPDSEKFVPIKDAFKQYPAESFEFKKGLVTAVDLQGRTVSIRDEAVPFHSLVIASGAQTPTPLTSLHGPHDVSLQALKEMRAKLAKKPETIVIAGGGPVGVETAGEISEALNGTPTSKRAKPTTKVILLAGDRKLLPALPEKFAKRAEKLLRRLSVEVKYGGGYRVTSSTVDATTGKTTLNLSNGETMSADVYLPAWGTTPNTNFLPKSVLDSKGLVKTATTLHVEGAPERVYAVGDVGNYSPGGIMRMQAAIPVLCSNMAADLGIQGFRIQRFSKNLDNTQVVPVGRTKGLGAFKGFSMPSFVVMQVKGKNYLQPQMKAMYDGSHWGKPVVA